jgi:surfeit locus 1 family protein
MKRIPVFSSLLVALAVAAMIALGFWQLARLDEKTAALVRYRANLDLPAAAYPAVNPVDQTYLFRTLSGHCLRVVRWRTFGGQMPGGGPGWRHIADCATGAEGPGLVVDIGMSARPDQVPAWTGGQVRGTATLEPGDSSALARWLGRTTPQRLMIVSASPAPGLAPSPKPDPTHMPNNHFAYAVQWFLFAGVAVIIYGIALWRRMKPPA